MTATPSDASTSAASPVIFADNPSGAAPGSGETGGSAAAAAVQGAGPAGADLAQAQADPHTGSQPSSQPESQANPQADPFALRLREHEANQRMQWQEQVNKWRKEATEDPQMGGENLPVSVARAQLALDRFDESKRIGQMLEQTGYGNNPDILRFFNRLADALMEDGLVQGQAGGSMPPLEERMYAGWSSRSGSI